MPGREKWVIRIILAIAGFVALYRAKSEWCGGESIEPNHSLLVLDNVTNPAMARMILMTLFSDLAHCSILLNLGKALICPFPFGGTRHNSLARECDYY